MPDEISHLNLANHNQALIVHLVPTIELYADWITTIAFYKALHVVEAVFANDREIQHGMDHNHRDYILKTKPKYSKLYKHYRPLYAASMAGRYMQDGLTRFSDRFTTDRVMDEILKHNLHQVECSACHFMKTPEMLVRVSEIWRRETGPIPRALP